MIRGRQQDLLEFRRRAAGKDRAGNPNGDYQVIATAIGEVADSLYARSGSLASQEQEYTDIRVLVSWDPNLARVTAEDQIWLQDGRRLDIRGGPLGIAGKDMLTFLCVEHASEVVNR